MPEDDTMYKPSPWRKIYVIALIVLGVLAWIGAAALYLEVGL